MMDLNALTTFVEVVTSNGFSAAARRLGMPRSTVSLRIRSLEDALGVRLFKRSTRTVTLTDDGRRLFEQAQGALSTLRSVTQEFRSSHQELTGTVRLTAPADFPTSPLAEAIAAFRRTHPGVFVDVILTNTVLDLVANDIDVAVRVGLDNPQDMISRQVATFDYGLFASATWLDTHELPAHLSELQHFIGPPASIRNLLGRIIFGGERLPVPSVEANDYRMILDLVQLGAGIGLLPCVLCRKDVQERRLIQVRTEWIRAPVQISISFPTRKDITPRVRTFADHLVTTLRAFA
ncbi:LysR family transcriptional regulator [Microvirga sp. CF3062]|uniref:LysR family transcriptional regulator n=1 Tax=Microvirga sp. CF3062 TaxID=3110182 RepID=UPI002E7A85A3|nr:LysR family transcriptional regulator [Microvirga sp. CF3062]MEE1655735.1 LysR family transcriptional regulator [Microvirga sp. CF3062]